LGGQGLARFALGSGIALVELGRREGTAVNQEAVDPAGALGKRLAKDGGAAFRGRALAGVGAATPVDVSGDDMAVRRSGGRLGDLGRGGRGSSGERKSGNKHDREAHRY
jgi:hypothetical protein